MTVHVKRAYDEPGPDDGVRVLVDRLWPRGVAKDDLRIDEWLKDLTPSTELRQTLHATPGWKDGEGFDEFTRAYREELSSGNANEALEHLRDLIRHADTVTLITGVKHPERSHVSVLRELLR